MIIKIISPAEKVIKDAIDFFEKPATEITPQETRNLKKQLEDTNRASFSFNLSAMAINSNILKKDALDLKEAQEKIAYVEKEITTLTKAKNEQEITSDEFEFKKEVKKDKLKVFKSEATKLKEQREYHEEVRTTCSYDYKKNSVLLIEFHRKAAKNLGEKQIIEVRKNGEILLSSKLTLATKIKNFFHK